MIHLGVLLLALTVPVGEDSVASIIGEYQKAFSVWVLGFLTGSVG